MRIMNIEKNYIYLVDFLLPDYKWLAILFSYQINILLHYSKVQQHRQSS